MCVNSASSIVYVLDEFYMKLTNFQADPIEKKENHQIHLHKEAKKNSEYKRFNCGCIRTREHNHDDNGRGSKKRDEQIKMGRVHFCSLVNHNDVVRLQLEKMWATTSTSSITVC